MKTEQSRYRRAAASSCPEALHGERGFTLVEVLICTLILTIGMVAIAALLAVTTSMQIGAREAARSTRLAQDKVDDLMKLNFSSDPEVAVGGSLDTDVAGYSETPPAPFTGITLRWEVSEMPMPNDDLRVLTVRAVNLRAQRHRQTDLTTIIRQW